MQNQTIERTTLTNLLNNEEYTRKVLPFIKPEYFDVKEERIIFDEIQKFVDNYNKIPTQTSLEIEVSTRKDLNEVEHTKIVEIIKTLKKETIDFDWLVDTTEKFVQSSPNSSLGTELLSIISNSNLNGKPPSSVSLPIETFPYL